MMTTTTTTTSNQHLPQQPLHFTNPDARNEHTMENHRQVPLVQKDFNPTFYNPFETKHRRRTSRSQFKLLETSFQTNTKPNATMRRWLAQKLGMTPRSVQVWFQNRRAKAKLQLKRHYSSSSSSSLENDEHGDQYIDSNSNDPCFCFVPSIDQSHCCHNNQQQQYQCSPLTPLSCFSLPNNDEIHQWQLTCDLSMLINQQPQFQSPPDLIPWHPASSPVPSPLPTSPLNNTHYHHAGVPFHPVPMHKGSFHRLSEPIFDLQPTPMMVIPQQQTLDQFNGVSFL